jgi:hypothetical protein
VRGAARGFGLVVTVDYLQRIPNPLASEFGKEIKSVCKVAIHEFLVRLGSKIQKDFHRRIQKKSQPIGQDS